MKVAHNRGTGFPCAFSTEAYDWRVRKYYNNYNKTVQQKSISENFCKVDINLEMIGETLKIGTRRIIINILYLNNSDVSTIYGIPYGHFKLKFNTFCKKKQ